MQKNKMMVEATNVPVNVLLRLDSTLQQQRDDSGSKTRRHLAAQGK